jgi:hypothetical protein
VQREHLMKGRPSNEDRRMSRLHHAWRLRAYASEMGMDMSVDVAQVLLDQGGDVLARLRAIRDAQVRRIVHERQAAS